MTELFSLVLSLNVSFLDTLKHSYTALQTTCIHIVNDGVLSSDGQRLKVRLEI